MTVRFFLVKFDHVFALRFCFILGTNCASSRSRTAYGNSRIVIFLLWVDGACFRTLGDDDVCLSGCAPFEDRYVQRDLFIFASTLTFVSSLAYAFTTIVG